MIQQAIIRAKSYYEQGYKCVVDIDMKAYFDTVNHDKLMYYIEEKVQDKNVLRLIRQYLKNGILIDGLVKVSDEGTPQWNQLESSKLEKGQELLIYEKGDL